MRMKTCRRWVVSILFLVLSGFGAFARTLYVSASNGAPVAPYTNWTMAATRIQDALDATAGGDLVLVTNGVYATGGGFGAGMMNRISPWTTMLGLGMIAACALGAIYMPVEGLIDVVRRTSEAEVAVVLKEGTDGVTRVSMRSLGAVDVCRIADDHADHDRTVAKDDAVSARVRREFRES